MTFEPLVIVFLSGIAVVCGTHWLQVVMIEFLKYGGMDPW